MGFGVWGLGFRVWGLGFRVDDLGFMVYGLWLRVCGLGPEPERRISTSSTTCPEKVGLFGFRVKGLFRDQWFGCQVLVWESGFGFGVYSGPTTVYSGVMY